MVEVVVVRNISQRLCRAHSCHACPTGGGQFSGRTVMPCNRRALRRRRIRKSYRVSCNRSQRFP